jgi:hypothetical protein
MLARTMLRTLAAPRVVTTTFVTRSFAIGTQHDGSREVGKGGLKRRDSGLGFAPGKHAETATAEGEAAEGDAVEPIASKGAKKLKRRGSSWIKNDQPGL